MTQQMSYAEAFVHGLMDSMEQDRLVSMIGSAPLGLGPEGKLTEKIRGRFPDRVVDPPTSENGVAALGAGAAMAGARPFVDLCTASFIYLAWTQLANEASNGHFMSGGKLTVPVTYHCLEGVRGAGAPQHSQSPHAMLWNAPGIEILVPSMAEDVYGLVRSAIASPNPSIIFSHARLLGAVSAAPDRGQAIPLGKGQVKRPGKDVTIVGISIGVHRAIEAAELLAEEGIDAEVIDPRTLVPLDEELILASVAKTGRLVVIDETPSRCSAASEIAATVAQNGFASLRAPIMRVTRPDAPIPYSPPLEAALTPGTQAVAAVVRKLLS